MTSHAPVGRVRLSGGLVLLCLLTVGCAEIVPPPGGEVDRTGPTLIESDPPDGALGVGPRQSITLTFSEKLTRPDKGRGLFISPRPTVPPKISWKSNLIRVDLAEPLQVDQTYVIAVSSDVTDLRRNRLDSAVTIAFSTGQSIDSGSAGGTVRTSDGAPVAGWVVGLYRDLNFPDQESADSTYPAYLANTDQRGSFALRYLPPGDYRLLAFDDKNRDELFNAAVEQFATPDRRILIGGNLDLDQMILTTTEYDSAAPQVISVVSTRDGLIRARLNRAIDPSLLGGSPERMVLVDHAGADRYPAQALLETGGEDSQETLVLTAFFPDLPEGSYRLNAEYAADLPPLTYDSVLHRRLEDKSPPSVIETQPSKPSLFADQVVISQTFSEPLDTASLTDQTFALWESDTLLVQTTPVWQDRFHLTLIPERILPGRHYRLEITEFDLLDLAANRLGDSLRSYTFSTHNADSLGSVSGELSVGLEANHKAPAALTFRQVGSGREFNVDVGARSLSEENDIRAFGLDLPPGKYLLRGFLDRDGDGKLTPGGIRPFRLSETQAAHPDTISVRARFETAGVRFIID